MEDNTSNTEVEAVLKETEATLQGIINSCVHPDTALRAVMVDLTPIRKTLAKIKALQKPKE